MNSNRRLLRFAIFAALIIGVASCHHAEPKEVTTPGAAPTLYTRLGGQAGVDAVVGQFVTNISTDSRISHYFADTDLAQFKGNLSKLIAQLSGGPQKYTGRDMKTTHTGLGISGADFDALIEDLVKSMDQFKVGPKEKSDLLALLAPLRKDIVEK